MARFIRNQILIIRDRDYNVASRCIGTPTCRIVLRNLLPYLVSVIMLRMALTIPAAIGSEVFITYIGLGLSVETPSLGNLINDGRKVMMQAGPAVSAALPHHHPELCHHRVLPHRQRLRGRRRSRRTTCSKEGQKMEQESTDPFRQGPERASSTCGDKRSTPSAASPWTCTAARVLAIVGESGSGKSVFTKTLHGPAGRQRLHHRRHHRLLRPRQDPAACLT